MSNIGDVIELQKQNVEVVKCEQCGSLMVNVKPKEVEKGDLITLKRLSLTLTNPATKDQICLKCEIIREEEEHTFKKKVNDFFSGSSHDDDHSDSGFFGGGSSGGFGGGFGGFGGGGFSGGGASGSW